MFGYIKPHRPELRVRDWEVYRGVYCGICRRLGKRYGPLSRLILTYDSVFLAMLVASLGEQAPCFCARRCKLHPWRKEACCQADPALDFAADVTLLLFYQKLEDDSADEGFWKRMRSRVLRLLFRGAFKKAGALVPEALEITRTLTRRQAETEAQPGLPLDLYADPTGTALQELFALQAKDPGEERILRRIGYLLGRWVYFADAVEDLEEDRENAAFNPFLQGAGLAGLQEDYRQKAGQLLEATQVELAAAYELLEAKYYRPVLQNILYLGLTEARTRLLEPEKFRKKPEQVTLEP